MSTERGPGVEYGDADILNHTKQEHDSRGRFKFVAAIPPSGRLFESEWIHPDNVKKGLASSWCEAVRDQIDADWAENRKKIEENKQSRTADPIRTKETVVAEDQKVEVEGATVGVVDPEQFILNMLDTAEVAYNGALQAQIKAEERLATAGYDLRKWKAVAESLNIGEKENDKDTEFNQQVHDDLNTESEEVSDDETEST